jgi:hypothetical protein
VEDAAPGVSQGLWKYHRYEPKLFQPLREDEQATILATRLRRGGYRLPQAPLLAAIHSMKAMRSRFIFVRRRL